MPSVDCGRRRRRRCAGLRWLDKKVGTGVMAKKGPWRPQRTRVCTHVHAHAHRAAAAGDRVVVHFTLGAPARPGACRARVCTWAPPLA